MLLDDIKGKKVTLLGAGISNMPLAEMLTKLGAVLSVRDAKTDLGERAEKLNALGAKLILGENYLKDICEDVIFRSPGIRPDIPELTEAENRGAVLTSEMELFLSIAPCPVYAVTGSDGKSTTTTLTSLILRKIKGDENVFLGGNIGEPLLHRYTMMKPSDAVAAELSSFQLMTIDAPLECAVITNITPNHLNWHTGMDEYIYAKKRILRHAKRAVLNYDNEVTRNIASECDIPVTYFSKNPVPAGVMKEKDSAVYLDNGGIYYISSPAAEPEYIIARTDIKLPGMHNVENYMAAIAATIEVNNPTAVREVATTFGGVRHRLELVRVKDGISYYNSSIDSSPTRTAAALSALENRTITVICGGYDKHIPFEPLADAVLSNHSIRRMILTGATADKIYGVMINNPMYADRISGGFEILRDDDFTSAVKLASAQAALSGCDTVLLSPACASFDAFPNFEVRGEKFKSIVNEL